MRDIEERWAREVCGTGGIGEQIKRGGRAAERTL
jgi:hypothetical protein